jgi:hypothetical protein
MSIQIAKTVLKNFLSSDEANVLALTGAWGTGKTHAWNDALKENLSQIKFKNYSYVSLFGISSMAELRMALFTKSVATVTLDKKFDLETAQEHWRDLSKNWLKSQAARASSIAKALPYGSTVSLGLEAFAPNSVRNSLICFDDFERQKTLKSEEILGLIAELCEERGCKVALIFDETKLEDKAVAYRAYREKVIDFEVRYAPSVDEAFSLVFDSKFPNRELIRSNVSDLEITNIRILLKLYRLLSQINHVTTEVHPLVMSTLVTTSVLLCWCAYAPDETKPNIEDILKWNEWMHSFRKTEDQERAEMQWIKRFKAYGFTYVDDLSIAIARVVENGFIEGSGLLEITASLSEELRNKDLSHDFERAWNQFHGGFDGEPDQFIENLYSSSVQSAFRMSIGDLDASVMLLRDLQRDDLADKLIDEFIHARKETPGILNLSEHPFGGTVRDQKLRDEFAQVHVKLQRLPSLEDAVLFVINNSGYNPEHLEAMRQASVDDFYALLMKPRKDVKLASIVKWLMRWKGTENAVITDKAREALEKIKAINLLNHVRVSRYGI